MIDFFLNCYFWKAAPAARGQECWTKSKQNHGVLSSYIFDHPFTYNEVQYAYILLLWVVNKKQIQYNLDLDLAIYIYIFLSYSE